ncbi:hypothetical protein JOC95_003035 [Bacillus tianshenii]|uniref:Uncharacterized protein n=1 Tax=Sutcliffiella tianshenii TaxID=1463404 RepID=A0ABS2P2I8_9BACI|nr:hypothetical protein [Bacillus tianshenii]MBM7621162.1 hypothetical protein [Bacillus tianshenii]
MEQMLGWLVYYSDYFVLAILIGGAFYWLSFRKKVVVGIALIIVAIGVGYLQNEMKYTDFHEMTSGTIKDDSEIRSITIKVKDMESDSEKDSWKTIGQMTLEDEELVDRLLNDLKGLELKETNYSKYELNSKYIVEMLVVNEKDNLLVTDKLMFSIDKTHFSGYEIISDNDHLKTIEELVGSDRMEWYEGVEG